jgi:hypothetical protein
MCSVAIPVARSIGAKVATGQLFPMMIPTEWWTPPLGFRSYRLPRPVNRTAWKVVRRMSARAFGEDVPNAIRARYGIEHSPASQGGRGSRPTPPWSWSHRTTTATPRLTGRPWDGGGFSVWDGPARPAAR